MAPNNATKYALAIIAAAAILAAAYTTTHRYKIAGTLHGMPLILDSWTGKTLAAFP